ncbi:hypothetical protein ES703_120501 [subsurface metagenome]
MLPRSRLSDDSPLSHALRQESLAQGVIDLVGAGVCKILPLEIDPRPATVLGELSGEVEGRWPAAIIAEQRSQALLKAGVLLCLSVGLLQGIQGSHQCLRDKFTPELPEMPPLIR